MTQYGMSRAKAEAFGYTIDSNCYPNVAYMGPRLRPTEVHFVPTKTEEALHNTLVAFDEAAKAFTAFSKVITKIKESFPNFEEPDSDIED